MAKTRRINITLSEQDQHALKEMAEREGLDMSEFIRRSLRVYSYIDKARREGESVFVGTEDKHRELVVV